MPDQEPTHRWWKQQKVETMKDAGELANRICRERCGSYLTTSCNSNKFLMYYNKK